MSVILKHSISKRGEDMGYGFGGGCNDGDELLFFFLLLVILFCYPVLFRRC